MSPGAVHGGPFTRTRSRGHRTSSSFPGWDPQARALRCREPETRFCVVAIIFYGEPEAGVPRERLLGIRSPTLSAPPPHTHPHAPTRTPPSRAHAHAHTHPHAPTRTGSDVCGSSVASAGQWTLASLRGVQGQCPRQQDPSPGQLLGSPLTSACEGLPVGSHHKHGQSVPSSLFLTLLPLPSSHSPFLPPLSAGSSPQKRHRPLGGSSGLWPQAIPHGGTLGPILEKWLRGPWSSRPTHPLPACRQRHSHTCPEPTRPMLGDLRGAGARPPPPLLLSPGPCLL